LVDGIGLFPSSTIGLRQPEQLGPVGELSRWVSFLVAARISLVCFIVPSVKVTEFERRQLTAIRNELDQEYEAQVGLNVQSSKDAAQAKISSGFRT